MPSNRKPTLAGGPAPPPGVAPEGPAPPDGRSFVHECNNLLGGILNAANLLRRSKSEKDRDEAMDLIRDAVERAKGHINDLASLLGLPPAHPGAAPTAPAPAGAPEEGAARPSLLIVEDEEMNRTLLRKILESTGRYEVREAATGRAAIEQYRARPADLVILDISMPDLGGADVLERLLRIGGHTRALLVSGYIDPHDPLIRAPGVVGALQKPIEADLLLETVSKALKR